MKRLLVIDDQFGLRKQMYKSLEKGSNSKTKFSIRAVSFYQEKDWLEINLEDLEKKLGDCDAILLDIYLRKDGPEFISGDENILEFIQRNAKGVPIFLVSELWDDSNMNVFKNLSRENSVVGGIAVRTLKENPNEVFKIKWEILREIRRAQGILFFSDHERFPFHIMHLSDLQFGNTVDSSIQDSETIKIAMGSIAKSICEVARPQIVIVTGDIAEHGYPSEYEMAEKFLSQLLNHMGMKKEQLFLLPGNHDINLKYQLAPHIVFDPKEDIKPGSNPTLNLSERQCSPNSLAFAEFCHFARRATGRDDWNPRVNIGSTKGRQDYWISNSLIEFGVTLTALNSSANLSAANLKSPKIDIEIGTSIYDELKAIEGKMPTSDQLIHIIGTHHPFQPHGDGSDFVDNYETLLNPISDLKSPLVILSGHKHRKYRQTGTCGSKHSGRNFLDISAGTLRVDMTKLPLNTLRAFAMIKLSQEAIDNQNVCFEGGANKIEVQFYQLDGTDFESERPYAFTRGKDGNWISGD